MIHYLVVDNDTGAIVRSGTCASEEDALLQQQEGTRVLYGDQFHGKPGTHYCVGDEVLKLPAKPDPSALFDYTNKVWVSQATYVSKRIEAYPPLTDLADALYWQGKGDNSKMEAYLAACEAVKLTYPKPT